MDHPASPELNASGRRLEDAFGKYKLEAAATFATKVELAAVTTALHAQGLDVVKLQFELQAIRKSLDKLNTNIERVVWLILTAVIGGGLALIVRPVFG